MGEKAKRTVKVVGCDNRMVKAISDACVAANNDIKIIRNKEPDVVINGIGYTQVPQPKMSKRLSGILLMAEAFGGAHLYGEGGGKKKKVPAVNIVKEFELIHQKKSKLSRANRDLVEAEFHKNFREV